METKNKCSMRMRLLRKEKKQTIAGLASEMGISGSAISNYERGLRSPDADVLVKYANFFECTTDYLLGLDDNKNKLSYDSANEVLLELERSIAETGDAARILTNITSILNYSREQIKNVVKNDDSDDIERPFYTLIQSMSRALLKTNELVNNAADIDSISFLKFLRELDVDRSKTYAALSSYFFILLSNAGMNAIKDTEKQGLETIADLWSLYVSRFDYVCKEKNLPITIKIEGR